MLINGFVKKNDLLDVVYLQMVPNFNKSWTISYCVISFLPDFLTRIRRYLRIYGMVKPRLAVGSVVNNMDKPLEGGAVNHTKLRRRLGNV